MWLLSSLMILATTWKPPMWSLSSVTIKSTNWNLPSKCFLGSLFWYSLTDIWFYTITNFAAWNSTSELFSKANIGGRPRQAGRICIMLLSCCYCCQRNIMTLKNWPWALLPATKSIFLCQRLNLKTLNTATNDWATLEFRTDWTLTLSVVYTSTEST